MTKLYTPPDKRAFADGDWQWLPHHVQLQNELLLSTALDDITAQQVSELKSVRYISPSEPSPPLTELFYRRFFHPPARAIWISDTEPLVDVHAHLFMRCKGTQEEPIILADDDDPPRWLDNNSHLAGPMSFMERAHHHQRWSRWLRLKAVNEHGESVSQLSAAQVDVVGTPQGSDRPADSPSATRVYYAACKVLNVVYRLNDYAQLNLEDNRYPPPYIARITRIYKIVYAGNSPHSINNDWCIDLEWMWTLPQTFLAGIPADKVASRGAGRRREKRKRKHAVTSLKSLP